MNQPEVSIITPAYNCAKTIRETYESIKSQTFSSWEWIVVEDHSTDNSYEYIKEMTNGDERVIVLRTDTNSGAAITRNVGIEKASGHFIAFLDADDWWKKEKLEHQIQFMKDNNYAFTYTDYELTFENGKKKVYSPKKDFTNYKLLLRSCDIGTLTVIFDTSLIGKFYMPVDCEKREDHGMWLDITRRGTVAHRLKEALSVYRICGSSISFNKMKIIKYQYRVYRKHEKFSTIKSLWYLMLRTLNKIFYKY